MSHQGETQPSQTTTETASWLHLTCSRPHVPSVKISSVNNLWAASGGGGGGASAESQCSAPSSFHSLQSREGVCGLVLPGWQVQVRLVCCSAGARLGLGWARMMRGWELIDDNVQWWLVRDQVLSQVEMGLVWGVRRRTRSSLCLCVSGPDLAELPQDKY